MASAKLKIIVFLLGSLFFGNGSLRAFQQTSIVVPLGVADNFLSLEKCVYLAGKFSAELAGAYPSLVIVQKSCRRYQGEWAIVIEFRDQASSLPSGHFAIVEQKDLAITGNSLMMSYTAMVPVTETRAIELISLDANGNFAPHTVTYNVTRRVWEARTRSIEVDSLESFDEDVMLFLTERLFTRDRIGDHPIVASMSFVVYDGNSYKIVNIKTVNFATIPGPGNKCVIPFTGP